MAGTLWVVATPIGNLDDLTPRALKTLGSVDVIAAEDTRVTRKLLAANGLSVPLESYREHTRGGREDHLLELLAAGKSVALVSDAGTPNVADPGGRLVERCVAAAVDVRVIPGPSALTAAMAGAGLPLHHFTFYGFLPMKHGRQALIDRITASDEASILFEGPSKLVSLLEALAQRAPTARVVVARELTKIHETFHRGTATELVEYFHAHPEHVRGESTLIIVPSFV